VLGSPHRCTVRLRAETRKIGETRAPISAACELLISSVVVGGSTAKNHHKPVQRELLQSWAIGGLAGTGVSARWVGVGGTHGVQDRAQLRN